MVFNLKGRKPDKVRKKVKEVDLDEDEIATRADRFKSAPWYVKLFIQMKISMSELDPFNVVLLLSFVVLCMFIGISVILPWLNVIGEIPSKIPIISLLSGFSIGYFVSDFQSRKVRERLCEITIGGKTYIADNQKVDILPGGEVMYLTTYYGKALLNKDESNMRRYGKQRTIFIPNAVKEQFGSIYGRRAKAFPDSRLKKVWMNDIDHGILYMPRQLSETRLLKKLEAAEENIVVLNEIIDTFKESAQKIAADLRDYEGKMLVDLVNRTGKLQEAFMGKGLQSMIDSAMYRSRYGRTPYTRPFGTTPYERGSPDWNRITPRPSSEEEESNE